MKTDAVWRQTSFVVRYTLQSLGLIVFCGVLIRSFLVSSYVMSSASMLPNILPGDFLVASKWQARDAKRGDLVVLRCPSGRERICLKRIIGVPGDRIEFNANKFFINKHPATLKSLGGNFAEERVDGQSWAIWPKGRYKTMAPLVVPPDSFYVLNDKRSEPEDSREWGAVPRALIEANVKRIWLSLDWYEPDGQIRNWPRIRWERVGRKVD